MKTERLDKVLSHLGIGSRTDVKRLVRDKLVKVNDVIVRDPSVNVSLADKIQYKDEILNRKEHYYFMMNKAPDCITATEDSKEKTVMDYLSERHRNMNLFPVGRLDKETEGLLIFTTNGKFGHHYTSPKHHVEKEYYVEVNGRLTEEDSASFEKGIVLEDGYESMSAKLEILESGEVSKGRVYIKEGKFRQIRRMFVMLGKEVSYLKREKMGAIRLDPSLSIGKYRELTDEETSLLQNT
ncbi:pseudouridine synthase [Leptospira ilyithenensis]|uniref:Pseudouridine synthase n=1 Tax=Leptospira ilyithenensis TaxID=2484901 RepID=A0A4R9LRX9_9LEPT|nr:pseudouridine synthase [Leptospira ilyithenensis]TGN14034.1 rRNA pseudouridine synthase [Leptospira ilyithenensis]